TLRFESGTLSAVTSGTITLSAGTATQLTITTEPSATTTSGAAFTPQPVIQVRDAAGNPVGGAGVPVTAVIASGPAGATLSNATATTLASGAATFSGLAISGTAGSYTLRFESGPLTPATSSPITLSAGAAATLVKSSGDNLTGQVATRLQTPHVVLVSDATGNPVAGVTVTWTPASGSGSVNPPTSTSNASGIASTAWTLGTQAGPQTVQATGAGSPVTFSATATAGAAAQLTITTPPSATATSGAPVNQQPVLQVRDGSSEAGRGGEVPGTAVIASG